MVSKTFLGISIVCLVIVAAVFHYFLTYPTCVFRHSLPFVELVDGIENYKFKNDHIRAMAESIFDYRINNEYPDGPPSLYGGGLIPEKKDISDITLYKVVTANAPDFGSRVFSIPIYNHPKYIQCLKSYDIKEGSFNPIDNTKATRDIIQRDILKIDPKVDSPIENIRIFQNEIQQYSSQDLFRFLQNGFNTSYKIMR